MLLWQTVVMQTQALLWERDGMLMWPADVCLLPSPVTKEIGNYKPYKTEEAWLHLSSCQCRVEHADAGLYCRSRLVQTLPVAEIQLMPAVSCPTHLITPPGPGQGRYLIQRSKTRTVRMRVCSLSMWPSPLFICRPTVKNQEENPNPKP